jgi:UDP-N-acetylglucosamine--N-acetylmuramyl-(pentapeptide) pyrophosphoryl-undecaprenol N-acetylglucosamine transferase
MRTILFVGGGSVGHIAPCVAIWRAVEKLDSTCAAHFICANRADDRAFLEHEHVPFTPIDAPKLSLSFLWKFGRAVVQSAAVIRAHKPAVVFSKGGFVSLPVCIAATWHGIPIVLHESDAVSGRANRIVGLFAKQICVGFPQKTASKKVMLTGNPLRTEVQSGDKKTGYALTGFSGKRPVLLVMGGSQGALAINKAIDVLLPELLQTFDIIHLTGTGKSEAKNIPGYWAQSFVQHELPHLYAITDFAVSRAGAGSIAELAANRIATILVPLRGVGHDHQQRNAESVVHAGACIILQQESLVEKLPNTLQELQRDTAQREAITTHFAAFAHPDAAAKIAKVICNHIANTRR